MAANHDWLGPMWNQAWHIADDDWLAEDNSTQDITNSSVRRLPHLLKAKLSYTRFIGGNSCALNSDAVLLDRSR